MHLKANVNIMDFLKQVLFETPEGDRIALKSTLSQYIFCTIASNPELLKNGTINFKHEDDSRLLSEFLTD